MRNRKEGRNHCIAREEEAGSGPRVRRMLSCLGTVLQYDTRHLRYGSDVRDREKGHNHRSSVGSTQESDRCVLQQGGGTRGEKAKQEGLNAALDVRRPVLGRDSRWTSAFSSVVGIDVH